VQSLSINHHPLVVIDTFEQQPEMLFPKPVIEALWIHVVWHTMFSAFIFWFLKYQLLTASHNPTTVDQRANELLQVRQ
jgi:hypothetical protein